MTVKYLYVICFYPETVFMILFQKVFDLFLSGFYLEVLFDLTKYFNRQQAVSRRFYCRLVECLRLIFMFLNMYIFYIKHCDFTVKYLDVNMVLALRKLV